MIALFFFFSAAAFAEDAPDTTVLHMSQDTAVYDSRNALLELSGHVTVSQGSTVIRADSVKAFFKKDKSITLSGTASDESIDKLVASGNVTVEFESGEAFADEAEYRSDTRSIVLSGPGTKFVQGKNTISGSRIIYNRENGKVTVESSEDKSVEALIFSKDKL